MRGQVGRKIMADSCEWGYEERQAGGKRRGQSKGVVNVGKRVVPSRGEKSIPPAAGGDPIALERGLERGNASRTIVFKHACSLTLGMSASRCTPLVQPSDGSPYRFAQTFLFSGVRTLTTS